MAMGTEEDFGRWAALFLSGQEEAAPSGSDRNTVPAEDPRLTTAAHALLRSVDDGGIPAFMTTQLRQIALDNGIEVTAVMTPNEIISALRDCLRRA